jgi:hypothetical protein
MNTRDPELDFDDAYNNVTRAYRDAAHDMLNEKPSAAIDDAIRAAARRGVSAGPYSVAPRKSWISRFATPFAAAATVLLTGSLILFANRELPETFKHPLETKTVLQQKIVAEPTVPPERAPAQAPVQAPATALAESAARAEESQRRQISKTARGDSVVSRPAGTASVQGAAPIASPTKSLQTPAATPPPPPPKAIAPVPQSAAPPEARMKKISPTMNSNASLNTAPPAPPMPALPAAAAPAPTVVTTRERAPVTSAVIAQDQSAKDKNEIAATGAKADVPPPAYAPRAIAETASPASPALSEPSESQWIKRLGTLQAEGKTEPLRAELRRFRKAYPSAELPSALQDEWIKMNEEQAAKTPEGQR